MRIKSNFRDYYDGLQGTDLEAEPLYLRQTVEIERPHDVPLISSPKEGFATNPRFLIIEQFTVAFCGELHTGYHLTSNDVNGRNVAKQIVYSLEGIDAFIGKYYKQGAQDYWFGRADDWRDAKQLNWEIPRRRSLERSETVSEERRQAQQKAIRRALEDLKAPCILGAHPRGAVHPAMGQYRPLPEAVDVRQRYGYANSGHVFLNPNLTNVEFFRVVPAPQAYQAIRQWLSNQASPERPIPKIDDVTMAEAKGFDQFSFRKEARKKR